MSTLLDILVIGLQNGAIYSLVALGIALVYKATKILNFAHGEIGTTGAFVAFVIMAGGIDGLPERGRLLWATLAAIAVGALLGVGVNAFIERLPKTKSQQVTALVATVAIALLLVGAQIGIFQAQGRRFPRFIEGNPCLSGAGPGGECANPLTLGTVAVSWHTLIILATLAVTALLLTAFFKTRPGIALLATAQDPFAAELQGVSARAMTTIAWGAAGALGALAGVLGAGVFNSLTPGLMLSTFLIPGFTAAVLGGLTSMVGAVVGGLALGVTVAAANQIVQTFAVPVPGPPQAAVLAVLLLVLLLRPRGLLGKEA